MMCPSVYKNDLKCILRAGHHGALTCDPKNIYWTDHSIIWDYELDNYRSII